MPQHVVLRPGAASAVPDLLRRSSAGRLFAVIDGPAYAASGAEAVLSPCLGGGRATRFSEFEPNPKLGDVLRGIEAFRNSGARTVVAVGGGTAIDVAKLIRAVAPCVADATTGGPAPEEVVRTNGPLPPPAGPLIAVPTTAGTGSEATHFAVVYVRGEKFSLAAPSVLPDVAVVDSRLTDSLPPSVTAAAGLDAFCQAVESIWAVGATEESIGPAAEAVRLALRFLPEAVSRPSPPARDAMSRASHLAGRAINLTKTTLPHALSYGLTGRYGVPHGFAAATTLGPALLFNAGVTDDDCADPRGADAVRARIARLCGLLGAGDPEGAAAKIAGLLGEVGAPASPAAAGATDPHALRRLAAGVNVERLSNNPRRAAAEDLVRLLQGDGGSARGTTSPPAV